KLIRIAASNVSLSLGDGANTFLSITQGSGYFVIKNTGVPETSGIAGTLSGTVALNVPGVTLSGTLGVKVNTMTGAVNETFQVNGTNTTVSLPPGKFLRIDGTELKLGLFGSVTLSGDFAFEQMTTTGANPKSIVRISLSNVSFGLGDGTRDFVKITQGSGDFI